MQTLGQSCILGPAIIIGSDELPVQCFVSNSFHGMQARKKIAQAKVAAPNVVLRVIDDAVQVHGAAGVSQDTTLARLWAAVRTLRLADGPDAVHIASIAKMELAASRHIQPESRL